MCGALSCLCGVCTVPCEAQTSCASYPAAQCAPANAGSCEGEAQMVCRVACSRDLDCLVLSPQHTCSDGSCVDSSQSGVGGGPSEPQENGAGGTAGQASVCERGVVAPNEVLVLGDSFLATSHQITAFLEAEARDALVLQTGDRYRDSSRLVANALALSGNKGVADQYASAAADTPVRVAIMNGGGADVLLGSCDAPEAECPVLLAAAEAFAELLGTMAEDGVEDVVFVGYPDPEPEAALGKMNALRPLLESACASSPVPCHWVDLRPVFSGHYDEYVLADGLNPSEAGSKAAAEAIWSLMEAECIAQ